MDRYARRITAYLTEGLRDMSEEMATRLDQARKLALKHKAG